MQTTPLRAKTKFRSRKKLLDFIHPQKFCLIVCFTPSGQEIGFYDKLSKRKFFTAIFVERVFHCLPSKQEKRFRPLSCKLHGGTKVCKGRGSNFSLISCCLFCSLLFSFSWDGPYVLAQVHGEMFYSFQSTASLVEKIDFKKILR